MSGRRSLEEGITPERSTHGDGTCVGVGDPSRSLRSGEVVISSRVGGPYFSEVWRTVESVRLSSEFTDFVKEVEPRVRYALVAAYGPERGLEGTAEAFAYAWEHWERIRGMDNLGGYLYRAGSHHAARLWPTRPRFPEVSSASSPWVEPGLPVALARLSRRQRVAVVLVRAYGYTLKEVAELMGVAVPTVQTHVDRGLAKLRSFMGVNADV